MNNEEKNEIADLVWETVGDLTPLTVSDLAYLTLSTCLPEDELWLAVQNAPLTKYGQNLLSELSEFVDADLAREFVLWLVMLQEQDPENWGLESGERGPRESIPMEMAADAIRDEIAGGKFFRL